MSKNNDKDKQQRAVRDRLIKEITEQLEELSGHVDKKISNNDLRRLSERLALVFTFLRNMDQYPDEVPFFNPCDVLRREHVTSDLLDRYAGHDLRRTIKPETITLIKEHLASCTVCTARLKNFEAKLIVGQHVLRVSGKEPHRPSFDVDCVSGGPTTLTPGIGISAGAQRDDI
jgi:hypothetical protein